MTLHLNHVQIQFEFAHVVGVCEVRKRRREGARARVKVRWALEMRERRRPDGRFVRSARLIK